MDLRKEIDESAVLWQQYRNRVDELITEYKTKLGNPDAMHLSDMKVKFIGAQDAIGSFVTKAKNLSLKATLHAKEVEYGNRLDFRKSGETIDNSKVKGWLASSDENMMALEAEVLLDKCWHLKGVSKDYKEEITQRISIVKNEEFNSRQSETT